MTEFNFMEVAEGGPEEDQPTVLQPEVVEETTKDLVAIKESWAVYKSEIDSMKAQVAALKADDPGANDTATSMGKQAQKARLALEKKVDALIKDENEWVRGVRGAAKPWLEGFKAIESAAKNKIVECNRFKRLREKELADKAAAEAAEMTAKYEEQAKAVGVEPVVIPPPVIPKANHVTRTEDGSSSVKPHWTFEVENVHMIPRDYVMADEEKIKKAVEDGVRHIMGVRIFETDKVRWGA